MDLAKNIHRLQELMEQKPYYKAALLAANMVESGVEAEKVVITRRAAVLDGVPHDIEHLSIKYPYLNPENSYLEIESGKLGIYDLMAEGLFFTGEHTDKEPDKRKIIDRIRRAKETEKVIRRFMKLFEVESDCFCTQINVEGLKYDKSQTYRELSCFFAQYWKIMSVMSNGEVLRMLKVLPHISGIRGNLAQSAEAISFIMDMDVKITNEYLEIQEIETEYKVTELRLGDNFVLGSHLSKKEETLVVTISGLDMQQCGKFIKGRSNDLIINYLCDILLDVNASVQLKLIPNLENRSFYLSQTEANASYLGVNTYL